MKAFLYLLSGALVAPGALFAIYLRIIQTTIQEGTRFNNIWKALVYMFFRMVEVAVWAMYLLPLCFALWLALAFIPKYRIVGATLTSLVAAASIIEYFVGTGPLKLDQLFLPVLSLAGLAISGWLMWNATRG